MRIGFGLPHHGVLATAENIAAIAVRAEEAGYDSLWTLDRIIKTIDFVTPYPGSPDGSLGPEYDVVFEHLTTLTYVAALTSRVRLGVSVLNLPLYHPVLLAKRVATLDQLSGGRVDLGLGVGWSRDEFRAASVEFTRRGARSDDYLRALKALWSADDVEFSGEFVDIPRAVYGPKPVQRPHPPVYMGAFTPAALRRAGTLANGFAGCCAPVETILGFREQMLAAAMEAGRDPAEVRSVIRCNVHLGDDEVSTEGRPVGTGSFAQIRDDTVRMRDAGVEEVFFDIYHQNHLTPSEESRQLDLFRSVLP